MQLGDEEQHTEQAVDDGRDARQNFDDLIEDGAQVDLIDERDRLLQKRVLAVVFKVQPIGAPEGKKDRRKYAHRAADERRAQGDDDRIDQHGQDAEVVVRRRPRGAE